MRDAGRFDIIVVGGGINGTAIARDAAMRGFSALLLERDDFSNATSAWNSRLIHGGLRYLEHYEIGLVRESLREREWLLHAAPHLVRPLPFLLPFLRGARRSPLLLRAGMLAYDVLSFDRSVPGHRNLSAVEAGRKAPGLDPGRVRGAALYYDAQVDFAERLGVENAISAREHGAVLLTHTRVTNLIVEGPRVAGVEWVDELDGTPGLARGAITINATGPWADELPAGLPGSERPLVGGTKGTHLVVDPFPGAPRDCALYWEAASDGRPILLIPWQGRWLIGSTDIRYHGDPALARADASEIDYLLSETNAVLPGASLSRRSIRLVYTGVRPLPFDPDDDPARITRHHIVHDHAPALEGLITIVGGKLTTFRSLAQDAVDLASRKLGRGARSSTRTPLPGGEGDFAAFSWSLRSDCVAAGFPHPIADRLLSLYGTRAGEVAALAAEAGGGRILDERSGALAAEVAHAIQAESARTLTDVLMRRLMLGLDPDLPAAAVERTAEAMAARLRWPDDRVAREIDAYARTAAGLKLGRANGD